MSVNILLCEGVAGSPDISVLNKIVPYGVKVAPSYSKGAMHVRVEQHRQSVKESYCILDRDFDNEWDGIKDKPSQYIVNLPGVGTPTHYGWRWARREIENYLIDPEILGRILSPDELDISAYVLELENVRDQISIYQAARMALSLARIPPKYFTLNCSFGKKNGSEKHCFPNDACIDDVVCRKGIETNIEIFKQNTSIDSEKIFANYERLKLACSPEGSLYNDFMWVYAGKDLLWSMHTWLTKNLKGKLKGNGAWEFRDIIAQRIDELGDMNFYKVIPEWIEFRKILEAT